MLFTVTAFSNAARLVLSASALAAVLAGCSNGGASKPAGLLVEPQLVPEHLSRLASKWGAGGAFNANYHGIVSKHCFYGRCWYDLRGSGRATFIGKSRISGAFLCEGSYQEFGFKITSQHTPSNSIDMVVDNLERCREASGTTYSVHYGTGKFAKAAGGGRATLKIGGTFSMSLKGTLSF